MPLPAAAALLLLLAGPAACGQWTVKPECRAAYDACVDGCGARCDRGAARDPQRESGPDMSDTWTQDCGACESSCRDTRDRCNK